MEAADLDVLIVDDHEAMRVLLPRLLAKAGVTNVRTAASGAEGLAELEARPAALVLVDNNMPGMNGMEFIATVRASQTAAQPRIIMVSGTSSVAHTVDAMNAGADKVLVKPVSGSDLLEAINALFAV